MIVAWVHVDAALWHCWPRPLPAANRKRKCIAPASNSLGIIRTEAAQTSLVAVSINVLRLGQMLNIFTIVWHVQASKITGCWLSTSGHTVTEKQLASEVVHLPCPLSRLVSKTTVLHTLGLHHNLCRSCKAPVVQPCTLLGSRKSREGKLLVSPEHPLHLCHPLAVQALHSVVRAGTSGHTVPEKQLASEVVHLPCPLSRLVSKTTVLRTLRLHHNLCRSCKAPVVQPCMLLGSRKSRGE